MIISSVNGGNMFGDIHSSWCCYLWHSLSLSLSVCTLCAMLAYYAYMYDMYFVCVGMHTSVTHYNLELEETAYDSWTNERTSLPPVLFVHHILCTNKYALYCRSFLSLSVCLTLFFVGSNSLLLVRTETLLTYIFYEKTRMRWHSTTMRIAHTTHSHRQIDTHNRMAAQTWTICMCLLIECGALHIIPYWSRHIQFYI